MKNAELQEIDSWQ